MSTLFDSEVLQKLVSPEAQHLHRLLKELSRIGVGSIVSLPRIVVFGSQKAGKSSVLEAISRIRFPTDSGLCTRFATELEFRDGPQLRIHASVQFADGRPAKSLSYNGVQESDLPEMIRQAKEEMGLVGLDKSFSKDVLRLSIERPGMYPLQLVDLPGVFKTTSGDQTKEDIKTVDDLVRGYLEQPNSIIMLVTAAEGDYHNQSFREQLEKFGVPKSRTIGIITKPDKTECDQLKYFTSLALNQQGDSKLDLGWHVMRNRDTKNDTDDFDGRDSREDKFFAESDWAKIPRTDRGAKALQARLSKIQFDQLRRIIPEIMQEMSAKLAQREEELERLGTARPYIEDMRNFLTRKADAFQQLVKEAVEGRYNDAFFRRFPDHYNLRAQLRMFSSAFDYVLREKGADRIIVGDDGNTAGGSERREWLDEFLEANPYPVSDPEKCTYKDFGDELNREAAKTRGLEFPGTTNDNLAHRLFQKQSRKWEEMAQHHIDMVTTSARLFVEKAMEFVVGPAAANPTTEAILRIIVDDFFEERELVLKAKLEEFILPYREAYALPVDREFEVLKKARSDARRNKQILEQQRLILAATNGSEKDDEGKEVDISINGDQLRRLLFADRAPSEGEFAPGDILDKMQTYYELSLRTFTDNIINLAVESCLVRRIQYIFTPTSVGGMSDDRVKELAAETKDIRTRREDLMKEREKLKESLKYCNRYKPLTSISKTSTLTTETPKTTNAVAQETTLLKDLKIFGAKDTAGATRFTNFPPAPSWSGSRREDAGSNGVPQPSNSVQTSGETTSSSKTFIFSGKTHTIGKPEPWMPAAATPRNGFGLSSSPWFGQGSS
ncbi:hypothetical protein NHJ13051_002922 [Beauveria bassiana]